MDKSQVRSCLSASGSITYDPLTGVIGGSGGGGAAWGSITGTLSDQTDLQAALDALVPYTGATNDVDLDTFSLNAKSLHVKGTGGAGHLGLKHQSANATANANETAIFADSNGDLKTKNDALYYSTFKTSLNTADRTYTFPDANGTLALTNQLPTPAALTKVDDTNVTLTLGGTPATALLQATSLTLGWSGQLSVARGGTGLGTLGTANQLLRVNAGATALEYFTPTFLTGLTVGTTPIAGGTVGRVLFEGAGNVLQENAILNLNTTNGLIIGGITARATRQTLIASSDLATSKTFVIRNAADTVDRFTFLGDGTYYSQPTQSNFNAGNILQVHIENNSAVNIGVSFLGSSRTGLVFLNNADSAIKLGLVQGGAIQPLFYSRWEQDFRGSNIRCLSTSSTMCGLTINNTGPSREWGMLVGNTSNATLGTGGFGLYDVTSSTYGLTINGSTLNVGIGSIVATARLHIRAGSATANTAPLKFTTGTNLTAAEAGAMEYNNTFHLTNSDAVRRHIVTAPNTTKVTAGAPYTNDGYITVNIGGTDFKLMTTA